MTNGGGPGHGRKRAKKSATKQAKGKKATLQRKGWLPPKAANAKTD